MADSGHAGHTGDWSRKATHEGGAAGHPQIKGSAGWPATPGWSVCGMEMSQEASPARTGAEGVRDTALSLPDG